MREEVEEGYSYTDTAEDAPESEESDMKSDLIAGAQREPKEFLTHIDDVPVEKTRPAPPVTEHLAKRIRWFCSRCQGMQECLEIDEPSQILKLRCSHHRAAVIRTIGAGL
jgi:hypothetical protein